MPLQEVDGRYVGPQLEKDILAFWRDNAVFKKSVEQRRRDKSARRFSFCEGPPTANGRPGIHHVLARTFKDIYPRYKTMRGFYAPLKAGWDTHGLPVEHEIEKELGVFDKARIEREVGIAEFTRRCRESVMRYIGDWEKMTERMGFWVDLGGAYYTLDNRYIESVWHLLKKIWDQGLIYQGYKVVPYDPRIGATLSSHEVALGYKEVSDPSVYVRFRAADEDNVSFLVWTTTPWTLPSNLLLAVGEDVDYCHVKVGGEVLIVAAALREAALGEDAGGEVIKTVKGRELIGRRYQRLFDDLKVDAPAAFQVVAGDFVSTEDGTGIVHIAPAYGVDDLALGEKHGLPVVHGVGLDGCFTEEVTAVAGKFFKDADPLLVDLLKQRGLLYRAQKYLHNYPHGWRTGDPLLYYAKNAWYIRTTAVRERMVELNKTINWVPSTIRDGRFGNWLENNVDWALSRERFWGTPLPLWTDGGGGYVCIGSLAELEKLCGRELGEVDLHRPAIDEVTFERGGKTWRRVPEVIDCWFDSGAMSYAQWHYPFENRETFARHFPADYICEAIDQTRGWFYTMHAVAVLVSDSVAYRNCVCLSHIVDQDGRKMSKSLGNIVDPGEVFDTIGADALRWYFLARVPPDGQKRISVDIVAEVAGTFINTLWNTYAFFVMYARLDGVDFTRGVALAKRPEIDRWIMALLHRTVTTATDALDAFDARAAGQAVEAFVDQLSNWYVRRSRRRFWKAEAGEDKQAAYLTLRQCLGTVQLLIAPFMPFLAEAMFQNLARGLSPKAALSVHMSDWPEAEDSWRDNALLAEVAAAQKVTALGRAAREKSRLRVRQPLPRLLVSAPDAASRRAVDKHRRQILEELNVKEMEFIAGDAGLVQFRIKPNLPRIGRQFGKETPAIRKALAEADGADVAAAVRGGETVTVTVGSREVTLGAEDVLVETVAAAGYACAEQDGFLVALDTAVDEALQLEGLAREMVRTVQDARKQAGLAVADRIVLRISGDGEAEVEAALAQHRDFIMNETLAVEWGADDIKGAFTIGHEFSDGRRPHRWRIALARIG